jgi:hypothetical protein
MNKMQKNYVQLLCPRPDADATFVGPLRLIEGVSTTQIAKVAFLLVWTCQEIASPQRSTADMSRCRQMTQRSSGRISD